MRGFLFTCKFVLHIVGIGERVFKRRKETEFLPFRFSMSHRVTCLVFLFFYCWITYNPPPRRLGGKKRLDGGIHTMRIVRPHNPPLSVITICRGFLLLSVLILYTTRASHTQLHHDPARSKVHHSLSLYRRDGK